MWEIDYSKVDPVWVGTEAGLMQHLRNLAMIEAKTMQAQVSFGDDDDEDQAPYLLTKLGSTAIITIHGSLKTSASWYDSWFNLASYPAIRHALYEAEKDEEVQRIVLDIASPGGQAMGVDETADLIAKINERKPVIAVATGDMCSGAYWLGCSATKVYANQLSTVGSIGAVMTHIDRTKELENEGIKITFIRSGEFKMIGTPYEKLDEKSRQVMQTMVDTIDRVFVSHVAKARGKSEDYIRQGPGQGKVFMGQASVDVGLVDEIATMNQVLSLAVAGKFDKQPAGHQNPYQLKVSTGTDDMTEEQKAAIAAAMAANGLSGQDGPSEAEIAAASAASAASASSQASSVTSQEGEGTGVADTKVEGTDSQGAEVAVDTGAIGILTSQLDAKTQALAEANVKIQGFEAAAASNEATLKAMSEIVAKSISGMNIALGISAGDYEGVDPAALLKEHARVSASFVSKFKAGGVAATAASQEAATSSATGFNAAAIAATKLA